MFGLEIKTSHTDDPKYFKGGPYHLGYTGMKCG